MATYNGSKYVLEQLESFSNQTRLPDEVVVSDDCSDDATLQIVSDFAAKAPFKMRVHQNDFNVGYAQNFGEALSQCTGDMTLLSDQDDIWFPEKIKKIEKMFVDNPSDQLLITDAEFTDEKLSPTGLTKLGQIRSARLGDELFVMGCCVSIRKGLLDVCLPIPKGIAHDNWIVGFADKLGVKKIIPNVYQYYRQHEDNTSVHYVNSTKKAFYLKSLIYKLAKLRQAGSRKFTLESELYLIKSIMSRIAERRADFSIIIASETLMQTETTLAFENESIEKRLNVLQSSGFNRVYSVSLYWLCGGYKRSKGSSGKGMMSAIRDMVD